MPRAAWKGMLSVSLVQIPIKVYPATESTDALAFHQLHTECQTRIHQRRWCHTCGREVLSAEIVKGFEFERGHYVLLLEAELDAVRPSSTHVIDLVQFADAAALDPSSVDRTYYLAPDGGPAADAYAVLRDGMQGKIGIGKLALYGREYLVAVRARARVLVLHTLHHPAALRDADAIDDLNSLRDLVPDAAQVRLARQIIAACSSDGLDLAPYTDDYRAAVQRLIDAKIAGQEIVVPVVVDEPPAVLTLRAALERSLHAVRVAKKIPARRSAPKAVRRAS